MGVLTNAPLGFSSAVSTLNSLPQGILAEMCQDAMAFLQSDVAYLPSEHHQMALSGLDISPKPDAGNCLNALTFLFKSAASEGASVESLVSELKSSMMWSDSCVAVVRHIWKEEGPALCGKPKETLLVGQLLSMDWQLGMAMSSSSCRSLNSPYLTLQFNLADPSGALRKKTLQMTVAEFQNLAGQLKDMASALETAA
ncbi:COMM domain-containing protein 6 [Geodia barretti]|uniref:COMM domain-containing protein 6 n=1 Tax=Geodia barretti TaxID=519541 RepID=A0AA35T9Q6_GEOBA|nr:COMM domain-containing protein 6 [Geodia barretti]